MKRTIAALALCLPLLAQAGELSISCIGAESRNCLVAIDVTPYRERFTAQFVQKTPTGGSVASTLGWCGSDVSGLGRWDSDGGCVATGKFRILNGALTKQQLADSAMRFEIHALMALCHNGIFSPECSLVVGPAPRPATQRPRANGKSLARGACYGIGRLHGRIRMRAQRSVSLPCLPVMAENSTSATKVSKRTAPAAMAWPVKYSASGARTPTAIHRT